MNAESSEPGSRHLLGFVTSLFRHREKPITGFPFTQKDFNALTPVQREMISGVFELSTLNARDIMIPRVDVQAVEQATPLKNLIAVIEAAGHSRLPVFEETIDNVVGILYVKELLPFIRKKPDKFSLKKLLNTPYFVPETMALEELLYEFKVRKLHMAVVVDEYGGMSGIVTLEDVLEEIVGDIRDEFDTEELPEILKVGNKTWEIDPRMTLGDFNEHLSCNLDTENGFDTVGGFVLDLFGRIPEKDELVRHESITFKIKDIKGTVINRITVTLSGKK